MRFSTLALAALACSANAANAQIIFTEIQPNLIGNDDGEWFELQNVGSSSVSIGGWTISHFSMGNESNTRWAFPVTASVAPGQVVVITAQAARFTQVFPGVVPSYELAIGADDMGVPNLTPSTGNSFSLGNNGGGVALRDGMGAWVDGVEYGTNDIAAIPGLPYPNIPSPTAMNNASITRVMRTGSSAVDYSDRFQASPGVGFAMLVGPQITNVRARPRHIAYGETYAVTASITSAEPILPGNVELYFSTATSSRGPAVDDYAPAELNLVGGSSLAYSYEAHIETFVAGRNFGAPSTFHEVYARWYLRAQDAVGHVTVEPSMASEGAANTNYLPTYNQNVLPAQPTPIAEAREEGAGRPGPRWRGHSVRVRGVALSSVDVVQPGKLQFCMQDASGKAITIFDNALDPTRYSFGPGQLVTVTGTLNDFRGNTQIGANVKLDVEMGTGPVPTTTVTIAQILAGGNELESQLVTIRDAHFVGGNPATWPSDPTPGVSWNVTVSDDTGEIVLRVTSGALGLFGAAAPQFGFHVTGLLNERDGAWQVFPRSAADVIAKPMPPSPDAGAEPDAAPGADAAASPADAGVASRSDSGAAPVLPMPAEDSGCSCATHARGPSAESILWTLAIVGLGLARRRQSRS